MARVKYQYNQETCRYEPAKLRGKHLRASVVIFLAASLALAFAGYSYYVNTFGSLQESILEQKNHRLKAEWQILEERLNRSQLELQALIDKDDHNYRIILDSGPLQPSIREAGIGGSEKLNVEELGKLPFVLSEYQKMLRLKHQVEVEAQSYAELDDLLKEKTEMWASRPAIQPISNKQLDKLHLTYGARFHPIFHVFQDHKGLDFVAAKGTPVYATGDGEIAMAYYSGSYGNVIYLNHHHEYETRYAHLSSFAVQPGEHVKRGQIIGYVGSTGNSVSAHLHYEVLYKGQHVNPINFFQRDLSNKEYEKLIEIGSKQNIVLD
jgi:murein DD-endopeptidase MepM/ murein hydrolase activator NlpD